MPKNHGLYIKPPPKGERFAPENAPQFRYGLHGIIDALKRPAFSPTNAKREYALWLEYHFRSLCQRFVFALQNLNSIVQNLAGCYSHDRMPTYGTMALSFQAEYHADHVLSYLGTLVDDVAQAIIIATGVTHPKQRIESMGDLKRDAVKILPALAQVKPLLDQITTPGPHWWDLAFKPHAGARQLLIHNLHLVSLQASAAPGGPFEIRGAVASPFAPSTFAHTDFFGLIRGILASLFDWLDRLETQLTAVLQVKDSTWSPPARCHSFPLPVGYPPGQTHYDPVYFPIPVCDGSDPLPWSAEVSVPDDHGLSHEDIAYGAFCVYEEESRGGACLGEKEHWDEAIRRLKRLGAGGHR
jgi:hypothetical protein